MQNETLGFMLIVFWVVGVVLAKGFWSTFFAITIPFWSWYLVVEKILMSIGWV